jgi:tyrosine-protein kinase Etk/Wzc
MKVFDPERAEASAPVRVAAPTTPDLEGPSIAEYFYTLSQARVLISLVTVGFVVLGVAYVAFATPVYRADIAVQVEESGKSIAGLAEVQTLLGDEGLPADTEMEILRSRTLLGAVVDQLGLAVTASPRRFPFLGAIARRYRGATPAEPPFGLASYAWGGERIQVDRLDVPDGLLNVPLTLLASQNGGYVLDGPAGEQILKGNVGKPAAGTYRGGSVQMFVSDLSARPGTRFDVQRRSRLRVIDDLQNALRIGETIRKTGILQVALDGPDPVRTAAILDAIGTTYVRQNVERKSEEAAKTLDFIDSQLPTLKANLDAAEAALQGYQEQKGTLDLSRQAQAMLARSVEIEKSISENELERSDLRQRFTESHPALVSLSQKLAELRAERARVDARMHDLPGTELESARLTRDVKVASELYNLLLNRAQELRVVKSGTIGNVRILDRAAASDRPVRPLTSIVLVMSLMLGLVSGVTAAFARKSLYAGLDDPELVEHLTGVTVYATVPRSARQASLSRSAGRRTAPSLLAAIEPSDPAVEAMRSLRTGLQFALLETTNKVIVVTGPTAGVGKSFVTMNLAHVLATAGRRVLVIDGDLRRGTVHKFFAEERRPGLSDVLAGTTLLSEAIRNSPLENLHWLPTGRIPPNPAELLVSERFERVLSSLSSRYDLVLIDTAPILPVTDAAIIGRLAATTLLVLRAGAHPAREILTAIKRLAQNGVRVQGAVFNDVSGAGARYSKYGYQYRYDGRA